MNKKFDYEIKRFDEENRVVEVHFGGGAFAHIQLGYPFPTEADHLDAIVRQFAPSENQIEAAKADSTELNKLMKKMIGAVRTTDRLPDRGPQPSPQEEAQTNDLDLQEARLVALIERVVDERMGLKK